MKPVFILSLPRSGSTLLQRILSSHPAVASTGEPWLLLPLIYAGREKGLVSEYGHASAYRSHLDLLNNLPNGRADYLRCCADMAMALYRQVARDGELVFVDKTPRYYLIIPELLEMFPEGRFIFLYRNPVATIASLLSFHGRKARYLYLSRDDVVKGSLLLDCGSRLAGERALMISYEKLIANPEAEVSRAMEYIGLSFKSRQLTSFNEVNFGRGDPFGSTQYRFVENKTIDKWRHTLDTPFLRDLAARWLREIGGEVLTRQGYSLDDLLAQLESERPAWRSDSAGDWIDYHLGHIYARLQLNLRVRDGNPYTYLR